MNLLHLQGVPILRQLQIEEALLRLDNRNWCIINSHSTPAIVMGISNCKEKLLNMALVKKDNVLIIKRFSGGGTVYIDEETLFVTFLLNFSDFNLSPFPKALLHWSEAIYRPIFSPHPFALRENDYVIGDKKMGGNAEYVRKERGLLHTSFLWNFSLDKMNYLSLPEKRPHYRQDRSHSDFLTPLTSYFSTKESFKESVLSHGQTLFSWKPIDLAEIDSLLSLPHRKNTEIVGL